MHELFRFSRVLVEKSGNNQTAQKLDFFSSHVRLATTANGYPLFAYYVPLDDDFLQTAQAIMNEARGWGYTFQ